MAGLLDRFNKNLGNGEALGILGAYLMAAGAPTTDPSQSAKMLAQGSQAFANSRRQSREDAERAKFRDAQIKVLEEQNRIRSESVANKDAAERNRLGLLWGPSGPWRNPDTGEISPPVGLLSKVPEDKRALIFGMEQASPGAGFKAAWEALSPEKETFGQPIAATGPDGKPVLVRPGSRGTMQPIQGYSPIPKETKEKERRIVKGPDGRDYYEDTKQPVLPGVRTPAQQFNDMMNPGDTSGGGGNKPNRQPTVQELFAGLPPDVQAGIRMSADPQKAMSSYLLKSKGLDIQFGPDGQIASITQGGQNALAPRTKGTVEDKLLSAGDTLSQLSAIEAKFKPEYQQIGTRWDMLTTAWKEKGNIQTDPASKQALEDFTKYKAEAGQLFALTLKDLSGVAVNPTEFERAKAWLPNPGNGLFDGDSPTELKSKTERFKDFTKKALAKYTYIKRAGLDVNSVDVDKMPSIIKNRGNEIQKAYEKQGLSGEDLKNAVINKLTEEFGIGIR